MADDLQISPADRDIAIRTMLGEEGNPEAQAGVASTMLNRATSGKYGGKSLSAVAFAPGQFEPWATRSKELLDIPETHPSYQRAAQIFDGVVSGDVPDFTNGATHFYAPDAQTALGRAAPKWGRGEPNAALGKTLFFAPEGPVKYSPAGKAIDVATNLPDPFSEYETAGASKPATGPSAKAGESLPDPFSEYPTAAAKAAPEPSVKVPAPAVPAAPQGPLSNVAGEGTLDAAGKNVGTGIIKGLADIPGFVGNTSNLADYLISRGESAMTGKPLEQVQAEHAASMAKMKEAQSASPIGKIIQAIPNANDLPTGATIAAPVLAKTGEYQPETWLGRAAQTGVEAAVGSLGPGVRGSAAPAAIGPKALIAPGVAGGAGQAATDYTGDPLVGLAASALPGVAMKGGAAAVNRLAGRVQPETAALAETARNKFDIPVNAGQMSESPAVRFAESTLNRMPFSGAGKEAATQQNAFNRAAANTIGEDSPKLTPNVMSTAKARIGKDFDTVAANTTIKADPQFQNGLQTAMLGASKELATSEMTPLHSIFDNIVSKIGPTGEIDGSVYQALTRKGTPLARAIDSPNPNVSHWAGEIRGVLDDALQRSAPPDMQNLLSQARGQYRNMKILEPLVAKGTTGDISPALLQGRVNANTGNALAYGGGGDLGTLSRIGQRFLKEPASSGTAERMATQNMFSRIGALGMGAIGLNQIAPSVFSGLPENAGLAAASIPASLAAGRAIGSTLRSNWLSNSMINRSLGRPQTPGVSNEFLNAVAPYALAPQLPQR